MAKCQIKKVIKIGNSYCITVSKAMLCYLDLKPNDYIMQTLHSNRLVIKKLQDYYEDKFEGS